MRVAQISPLYERVPPQLYGGTERVVSNLTDSLVRLGHDVTLFATADSVTSARLVPMASSGVRLNGCQNPLAMHIAMLEEIYANADQFDVIHSHVDILAFPFARHSATQTLSTIHGRLDIPEHRRVMSRFTDLPLVSISNAQRSPVSDLGLNWISTVYNGVNMESFFAVPSPENPPYLVFLGRISPEKGPVRAIEIARAAGVKLIIAAKIDPADEEWASRHFLPLIDLPGIEFIGEIDERRKAELLTGACGLLFPINWPEPFGIVLIEAMASGTPVIAFRGGSVEEIVVDGVTGFVCDDEQQAVDAIRLLPQIDRLACREHAIQQFSSERMTAGYVAAYQRLVERSNNGTHISDSLQEVPVADPSLDENLVEVAEIRT